MLHSSFFLIQTLNRRSCVAAGGKKLEDQSLAGLDSPPAYDHVCGAASFARISTLADLKFIDGVALVIDQPANLARDPGSLLVMGLPFAVLSVI